MTLRHLCHLRPVIWVRPERVVTLSDDEIRGVGFSRPKVTFIKDLAARVLDGRPDILPADDLGLMNAAHRVYSLRKRPTPDQLRKRGEAWRPYRSVAAWYLWASLSEGGG